VSSKRAVVSGGQATVRSDWVARGKEDNVARQEGRRCGTRW
jgi:hypothetical protein